MPALLGKTGGGLLGPTGGASADPLPSQGESMPPAWRAFRRSCRSCWRRPWLMKSSSRSKGERLFGGDGSRRILRSKTGYWNLVGWRIVDGQPKVRSMVIDKPWTAVAKGDVDPLDELPLECRWLEYEPLHQAG